MLVTSYRRFGNSQAIFASMRTQSRACTARVYSELERAGVLETRRGVGSFVSATRAQARPRRERDRRLSAFVTRLLADADTEGFTSDDVLAALRAHVRGGT